MSFPLIWRSKPRRADSVFTSFVFRYSMVRHVVNPRRRGSWRCIARNHKRIRAAKDPITLGACITDDLHSKEIRIEVTRLRVVVDLIREVVDGNGLEPFDSSSDAAVALAAAAMRARLLISWCRVIRPR